MFDFVVCQWSIPRRVTTNNIFTAAKQMVTSANQGLATKVETIQTLVFMFLLVWMMVFHVFHVIPACGNLQVCC